MEEVPADLYKKLPGLRRREYFLLNHRREPAENPRDKHPKKKRFTLDEILEDFSKQSAISELAIKDGEIADRYSDLLVKGFEIIRYIDITKDPIETYYLIMENSLLETLLAVNEDKLMNKEELLFDLLAMHRELWLLTTEGKEYLLGEISKGNLIPIRLEPSVDFIYSSQTPIDQSLLSELYQLAKRYNHLMPPVNINNMGLYFKRAS